MAVETAEPAELMETLDLRRVARVLPFGGQVPVPYGGGYEAPEAYDTHDGYGTHDTYAPNAPYSTHDPYSASSAGPDAYALEPGPTPTPAPIPTPARHSSHRRRRPTPPPPHLPQSENTEAAPHHPTTRNLRRLVPQALVVAFLAGGTSAFVANDKAVELSVDGAPRTMHTFADNVAELLADEGVTVGAHDIIAPAPGAELASGDEVVVRYGRPVLLTLDGHRRQVWTTARTVDGALRQLGVRAEGAFLSVSRSSPIARHGLALDVRTERAVTFMADGRERTIRTNAATVGEALAQAGITLRGQHTTAVARDTNPRDGQTVTVLRITGREEVREEAIPYDTVTTRDASLFKGTEVVDRQGRQGARRITYALRTVNGVRQKPRRLHDEIVREPVTQRVRVGTKEMPRSVAGADGLNWSGLAACESGGRPGAVDASGNYGGLYQFDTGTWRSLGGSGRPQDAPAAEQTFRAKKLYVQRGASPWPHCGRRLTG
ncbi:ubiquitin-like domain-containing protein [Streptomyces sp. SID1121]|uniref:ubiquitin-like domain-containing protein n=1 Tax=Streptomyces sp. SID1121 TaxID=3425888 RepID=UPI0040573BD8